MEDVTTGQGLWTTIQVEGLLAHNALLQRLARKGAQALKKYRISVILIYIYILLYYTVQDCAKLYGTAMHCTVLYHTNLYAAIL